MTDPIVTIVYFAIVLLVFCAVAAIWESIIERRERREAREWNRAMRRRSQ
jgi:flagellar biosynthesis/type III secretory pathway M-ring protein FliF/YscJ